jgi:phosphoribosylformylglycinamidine synthase
MPKTGLLDPQGAAVQHALGSLGLEGVAQVRVGKLIELELSGADTPELRKKLELLCHDLLSNPVIEDYVLEIKS